VILQPVVEHIFDKVELYHALLVGFFTSTRFVLLHGEEEERENEAISFSTGLVHVLACETS
jgi:hypothetical protein